MASVRGMAGARCRPAGLSRPAPLTRAGSAWHGQPRAFWQGTACSRRVLSVRAGAAVSAQVEPMEQNKLEDPGQAPSSIRAHEKVKV